MNLTLAIVALLGMLQEPKNPADERKLSPEEVKRRKDEMFKDAEEKYKTFKSWKSVLKITESNPAMDATFNYEGGVWVKILVDEAKTRLLYWEVKQYEHQPDSNNEVKRVDIESSRSLFTAKSLKVSWDVQKILENYDFSSDLDLYFPQMFLRDGLVREIEKSFSVEIMRNPRYENLKPTEWDWSHLGFKTQEEFDAWWKARKAQATGGAETGFKEDRPFKDKEDKFDRENKRNNGDGSGGGEREAMYLIELRPTAEAIKRDIKKITVALRPADFLPVSVMLEMVNDAHVVIQLENLVKDPTGADEIKDDRFKLEAPGFTQKWPQRE